MNIIVFHLDLGIGGAEQLIVNLCKVIKEDLKYNLEILTSHHSHNHCFEETKPNGTRMLKLINIIIIVNNNSNNNTINNSNNDNNL